MDKQNTQTIRHNIFWCIVIENINNSLSNHEIEILSLLLDNYSVKEIADKLNKKRSAIYNSANRINLLFNNQSNCNAVLKFKYQEYLKYYDHNI